MTTSYVTGERIDSFMLMERDSLAQFSSYVFAGIALLSNVPKCN